MGNDEALKYSCERTNKTTKMLKGGQKILLTSKLQKLNCYQMDMIRHVKIWYTTNLLHMKYCILNMSMILKIMVSLNTLIDWICMLVCLMHFAIYNSLRVKLYVHPYVPLSQCPHLYDTSCIHSVIEFLWCAYPKFTDSLFSPWQCLQAPCYLWSTRGSVEEELPSYRIRMLTP